MIASDGETTYGGFGGESSHDAVGAQLEQMAHPTDFGVWAHLHALLAVLERLAVEKDVAQMQHCRVVGKKVVPDEK